MSTVMVGDDDKFICKIVEFNLRQRGYDIIIRNDGLEILNAAKELLPDLLILDLMLPTMGGKEVTQELRRDPQTANIPIIIVTAKGQRRDRVELIQAGATLFFNKPFDPNELMNAVGVLLSGSQKRPAL